MGVSGRGFSGGRWFRNTSWSNNIVDGGECTYGAFVEYGR